MNTRCPVEETDTSHNTSSTGPTMPRRPYRRLLVTAAAAGGVATFGLWGGVAYAAGAGYGPGPSQSGSTPPGGFTNVVTAQTVPATGGTVSASYNGQQVDVNVPAGDFSGPVQVSISTPTLSQIPGAVSSFDISFTVGGQPATGTLAKPVVFTVTGPSLKAGETVDIWNGSAWTPYADATVSNGSAQITITSDPAFAIMAASSTVPGSTTATTGIPMAGLGLLAGGLVLAGGAGLFVTRRRRATSNV